ncbi:hypothetical protein C8R43DRAFT_964256 [Mycena crocata]|nr:hypothetical protein C8R43DRAFT_964256 [Mycena crocata]
MHLNNPTDLFQFDSTKPTVHLECTFSDPDLLWQLNGLADIIARSSALEEVNLQLPRNIFAIYQGRSPRGALLALRKVMCAMAAKSKGPVIFLDDRHQAMVCFPRDLLTWNFHESLRTPGENAENLPARNHLGVKTVLFTVKKMHKLSMRSIRLSGSVKSCTLMINGADTRTALILGGDHSELSGDELTALLPHTTYPKLSLLCIKDSTIDPHVLSDFLRRHPTIEHISYTPSQWSDPLVIVEPAVCLSSINYIRCSHSALLTHFLDGISTDMHCVQRVQVSSPDFSMVRSILPWLKKLSGLKEVTFARLPSLSVRLGKNLVTKLSWADLCPEVNAALPRVKIRVLDLGSKH